MKKNIKAYTLALCASLFVISCDNSLEEVVYSDVTEQNYNYSINDWNPNLLGAYNSIRSSSYASFWQTQELTGCAIVIAPNVSGWNDGGIFLKQHFHTWNSEQGQIGDVWNNLYRGIMLTNSAIERVEKGVIPAPTEKDKAEGLAELRAVRAYYYWLVCDNFGDAPIVTSMSQELPVNSKRSDIYNFIVKELKEAVPVLSEIQGEKMYGRFNKWAGKCLLANIYLNAEVYIGEAHYDDCIKECDDIINSHKCELSQLYKDPFRTSGVENSKEVLMTIPYDYSKGVVGNWLYMNSWHKELKKKFLTKATPNEAGGAKAIGQFIDVYQSGDGRLDDTWLHGLQYDAQGNQLYGQYDMPGVPLNFTKELPSATYTNEMEGYRLNKYEVEEGAQWSSNTDIPIFRYSEVLLMKAESLLRTNNPGAGALVTEVRKRNFEDYNQAVVTDDELKEDSSYPWGYVENYKIVDKGDQTPVKFGRMFDELCIEFAYETHNRRDMIRFGVFTTKSWLSHKPQGKYRVLFPIPESALMANPLLVQNPSYNN